jgi:hypothetical protein
MKVLLPDNDGHLNSYTLLGDYRPGTPLSRDSCRIIYSAAHVVADPFSLNNPHSASAIHWGDTLKFRRHLASLGLGIAEAMDTAQRGMGLDWKGALELIKQTRMELPNALVANGVGTDHIDLSTVTSIDQVVSAYNEQLVEVQKLDARVILMASRALAKVASSPKDYFTVYNQVLASCDHPVILHWLGEMFDPQLSGYWGVSNFENALNVVIEIIENNVDRIDGIKISLLDKEKEIIMRRRLPSTVKMYTGDDFNYPELIEGDNLGYSHALLGIFDPLADVASNAVSRLNENDVESYRQLLQPTVPLARHIFRSPTQYYKTGVVFLAWLNGFQEHFVMLKGAQSDRNLHDFSQTFQLADQANILVDPERACFKMKQLLAMYGL